MLPLLSGVQNFSLHLLDGLPADMYDIHVACKPGGNFVDATRKRGWRFIPLPSLVHPISPLDLISFFHLLWILKRERFDIVHTNSSKTGLLGRLAAWLIRVPMIVHTSHGLPFQKGQSPLKYGFFIFLEGLANHLCHKVIFVNNSDRLRCIEMKLITKSKATTINNALPISLVEKLSAIAKARSNRDEDTFTLGSTMRFSTQKNAVNLIACACRACESNPKLRFVIIGDGEHLELCRQIVRSHNLNARILLPGWDSRILDWLPLFDAFILYSRWEAQPFSLIEAMHSGLPLIGSKIPSIAELVEEDCGFLIDLDAHKELIKLLISLPEKRILLQKMGEAASKRISGICDYQTMVGSYRNIYEMDGVE
ncbi:MAG: glycosyltransferase [Candidatus Cloacimonadaceae bacterium]|nr:glycosyltransferase [Candidatus Cloacimonadaceae bacterium]